MTDLGIPEKLSSDNGPQFSSMEFRNWAKEWNIIQSTSSPHFPQSNGHAEAAVKAIKYLLAKTSPNGDINSPAFQEGLMELRNTPRAEGRSPAQILFGAPTRTKLPLHRHLFTSEWKEKSTLADQRAENLKAKARARFDASARWLSKLKPGDVVLVQDHISHRWNLLAEVLEICPRGRSFLVRTESGGLLRRNRRLLRRFVPPQVPPVAATPPVPVPRRSSRTRRPPARYLHSVRLSSKSNLEGGHEVSCLTIPHQHDAAFLLADAADSQAPTNGNPPRQSNATQKQA